MQMSAPKANDQFLGKGLYTAQQAAVLTGLPVGQISRWLRSHPVLDGKRQNSRKAYAVPLWVMLLPATSVKDMVVTFNDVLQLKIISVLRNEGIRLPRIRRALERSKRIHRNIYPFIRREFQLVSNKVYLHLKEDTEIPAAEDVDDGQLGFRDVLPMDLVRMERVWSALESVEFKTDDSPYRWWPHGKEAGILIDPNVEFGQPIIARLGLPVSRVISTVDRGSRALLENSFGLKKTEIDRALNFREYVS